MAAGVYGLASYIADAIKNAKKQGNAQQALVKGTNVLVGTSIVPYTVAIDTLIRDGDYVWVVLNESKTLALVVGK